MLRGDRIDRPGRRCRRSCEVRLAKQQDRAQLPLVTGVEGASTSSVPDRSRWAGSAVEGVWGAASSRSRSTTAAPALSRGSLLLPHLGDCTQEGQPLAQPQPSMTASVASSQSRPAR